MNLVTFFIFLTIISNIKSEWMKISENSYHPTPKTTFNFNTDEYLNSILNIQQRKAELQKPSQEWIDYQKFRFAVIENPQKPKIFINNNKSDSEQILISKDNNNLNQTLKLNVKLLPQSESGLEESTTTDPPFSDHTNRPGIQKQPDETQLKDRFVENGPITTTDSSPENVSTEKIVENQLKFQQNSKNYNRVSVLDRPWITTQNRTQFKDWHIENRPVTGATTDKTPEKIVKNQLKFQGNTKNYDRVYVSERPWTTTQNRTQFKDRHIENRPVIGTTTDSSPEIVSTEKIIKQQSKIKQNPKNSSENFQTKKLKSTPSISGFLEFLKTLQTNLISRTKLGILDKIQKLTELRDRLLLNIEDRIFALWPPKKSIKSKKRSKRGIFDESQTNFPSAETALMTINFLTFAVFLIKLVLQVINTIKSKHYNFNGFAVNTMEAIQLAKFKQNARHFGDSEMDIEQTAHILKSIDKLPN